MTADAPAGGGYRTLAGSGETQFTTRGSTFVGYAHPVGSVAAAEGVLERIAETHPDATHHVPAYRIRNDPPREYASDAGEPAGSAGSPVLHVLQARELLDVAVVVVRHFGGTELGYGGLVRAYGRAAGEAIDAAGVRETVPRAQFSVTVAYDDSGTVRSILESAEVDFEATYRERVRFVISAPVTAAASVRDRIRSATGGRATLA